MRQRPSTITAPTVAMMNPAASFGRVQVQGAANEAPDHGADDAEQHRDDDAATVAAGHYELGEGANDQAENDPTQDSHLRLLLLVLLVLLVDKLFISAVHLECTPRGHLSPAASRNPALWRLPRRYELLKQARCPDAF